jgi:hypothetical protein
LIPAVILLEERRQKATDTPTTNPS